MSVEKGDILVVDDDISHCTILEALLRGWGYQVSLAHNGREALEQVRQRVFDLVLCDIRMAEMDGIATLKEIKAWNPSIPVLIMTAYSSVGTAVEALKSGALDYVVKSAGAFVAMHRPAMQLRPLTQLASVVQAGSVLAMQRPTLSGRVSR